MTFAERMYRAAVVAYPADYREARGDEVLGTVLDATDGRRLPDVRELAAVVGDGWRRRVASTVTPIHGAARAGALWSAYALAVLTAAVALVGGMREDHLATSLPFGASGFGPRMHLVGVVTDPWFATFIVTALATLVALAASARRTALVLSLAGLGVQLWELARTPAVPLPGAGGHFAVYAWTDISTLPRKPWHWLVPAVLLPACIALSPRSTPPRVWARMLRVALAVGVALGLALAMNQLFGVAAGLIYAVIPLVIAALILAPIDPRPALACLALLATAAPLTWTYVHADPTTPASSGNVVLVGIPLVAALLAAAASVSVRRLRGGAPPPR